MALVRPKIHKTEKGECQHPQVKVVPHLTDQGITGQLKLHSHGDGNTRCDHLTRQLDEGIDVSNIIPYPQANDNQTTHGNSHEIGVNDVGNVVVNGGPKEERQGHG